MHSTAMTSETTGISVTLRQGRLGGGEPGDWHAEGRAADVGEAVLVAPGYRGGIAAVLTADTDLEPVRAGASQGDGHVDELSDPLAVQGAERVLFEDVGLQVVDQEAGLGVVPAERVRRLGQVIRADREEVGMLGEPVGGERGSRCFDHGAYLVVDC